MCDGFYFRFWSRLSRTSNKIYEKWSFLGIFSRLGCFSPVFGKVKVCFVSALHETMKVSHAIAFPIVFLYFLIEVSMEDCWSLWKMILFKYFLRLWSVSSRFWAGLGADHTLFYKNKESVLWLILLVFLGGRRRQWRVLKLKKSSQLRVSFAVYVLFPKFMNSVKNGFY